VSSSSTTADGARVHALISARSACAACTEDGPHALALLRDAVSTRRKPYDAVLLDWEMPIGTASRSRPAIRAEPAIAEVRWSC
jgi:hypothetical protein